MDPCSVCLQYQTETNPGEEKKLPAQVACLVGNKVLSCLIPQVSLKSIFKIRQTLKRKEFLFKEYLLATLLVLSLVTSDVECKDIVELSVG